MSSDTIPLSSIPTISSLYKDSTLQPLTPDPSLPLPSSSLNQKISLIRTSITNLGVTCIVNAANESLLGGGGVDGAIHRAAGRSLLTECRALNGCKTGSAKITTGHALPASYIIHAVGPVYASAKRKSATLPAELLAGCYTKSLELAAEKGGSIAFSCLSTGVYGYPSGEAAVVALGVVRAWLVRQEEEEEGEGEDGPKLERVVFCCFEAKDENAYLALIPKFFPPSPNDLLSSSPPKEPTPNTLPSSTSAAPLDTQATSLLAAAEKSANNEAPSTKKLKITNPDLESEDWETVEKPDDEDGGVDIDNAAAEKEMARSDALGSKSATGAEAKEPVGEEKEVDSGDGNLGKNRLLKDW